MLSSFRSAGRVLSASTPNSHALALRSSWLVNVQRVTQQQRFMSTSRARCSRVLPGPHATRAVSTGDNGTWHRGMRRPQPDPLKVNRTGYKTAKPAPKEDRLTVLTKKLNIKVSPSKLNPIAHLVASMPVLTALDNLRFLKKRSSADYMMVLNSAIEKAESQHGLKAHQLIIAQTWVVKGMIKKQVDIKAKGLSGIERTRHAHCFILLQESRRASRQRLATQARLNLGAEAEAVSETTTVPPASIAST